MIRRTTRLLLIALGLVAAPVAAQVDGSWVHETVIADSLHRWAVIRFAPDGTYQATVRLRDGDRLWLYPTITTGTWTFSADRLCIVPMTYAAEVCTAAEVRGDTLAWAAFRFTRLEAGLSSHLQVDDLAGGP